MAILPHPNQNRFPSGENTSIASTIDHPSDASMGFVAVLNFNGIISSPVIRAYSHDEFTNLLEEFVDLPAVREIAGILYNMRGMGFSDDGYVSKAYLHNKDPYMVYLKLHGSSYKVNRYRQHLMELYPNGTIKAMIVVGEAPLKAGWTECVLKPWHPSEQQTILNIQLAADWQLKSVIPEPIELSIPLCNNGSLRMAVRAKGVKHLTFDDNGMVARATLCVPATLVSRDGEEILNEGYGQDYIEKSRETGDGLISLSASLTNIRECSQLNFEHRISVAAP